MRCRLSLYLYNNFHNPWHAPAILIYSEKIEKLFCKKMCVLNKNRRTKVVSCRTLLSLALNLDFLPPLSSQPFSNVQKQDCQGHLGHLTVFLFFSFNEWFFSDYIIFPIKFYNCRLNRSLSPKTSVISARLVVQENKVKMLKFVQCN